MVIDNSTSLVEPKFTRPRGYQKMEIKRWISKDIKINNLQCERDRSWHEVHKNPADENWKTYRNRRYEIKKGIKEKKTQFDRKMLSPENSQEIWKVIHRILKPNIFTLHALTNHLKICWRKCNKLRSHAISHRFAYI